MADSFLDWTWQSRHVQSDIENGEYVSAESTLILSGPSRLDMLLGDAAVKEASAVPLTTVGRTMLMPMGLLQSARVGQNRQVVRLFEIGAKRSYFIPQRVFTSFDMNRVLFFGPSLMRLFYATAPQDAIRLMGGSPLNVADIGVTPQFLGVEEASQGANDLRSYARLFQFLNADQLQAGGGDREDEANQNRDFFTNLNSALFNVPFGLAFIYKDSKNRPYGSFYLEESFIEGHTITVTSQDVIIAEGVNGVSDLLLPVQLLAA